MRLSHTRRTFEYDAPLGAGGRRRTPAGGAGRRTFGYDAMGEMWLGAYQLQTGLVITKTSYDVFENRLTKPDERRGTQLEKFTL